MRLSVVATRVKVQVRACRVKRSRHKTSLFQFSNSNIISSPPVYYFICLNGQATYLAGRDPESAVSTERPHLPF
jgi:hypothetical protein